MSHQKITAQQMNTIRLVARSEDHGFGWRKCSPLVFDKLVLSMPDALVEKNRDACMARLTAAAEAIENWT